jgi:deoxyguanosine kinase
MQAAYLQDLTGRYDDYFRGYAGNLLTVEADRIDFVGDPEHERRLLDQIHSALGTVSAAD